MEPRNLFFGYFESFSVIFFASINPMIDSRLYDRS